jgi:hypothetical protein
MKKKVAAFILLILLVYGYFILYHRDKELKYIPQNADAVVVLDVKKATRQYLLSFLGNPSVWGQSETKDKKGMSIKDSGVKIPDFLQVFHLEKTGFSDWYCILELKDKSKFLIYLNQNGFSRKGNDLFRKGHFFIKMEGPYCIAGTSDSAFENIKSLFQKFSQRTNFSSDDFIDGSLGSISLISNNKIRNFPICLNSDHIEISNGQKENFYSVIDKLEKNNYFIDAELNKGNIESITSIFNRYISDSVQINSLKATAVLKQVNDTIITYSYDDDFNEIEKKTIQKIVQPDYAISLSTSHADKALQYFRNKKWVNAQSQFTAIPFQPNIIEKNPEGLEIYSTKKMFKAPNRFNTNYIFIKNKTLLFSKLKFLNSKERNIISDINSIFYGNEGQKYYLRLQFKKGNLPLMLRWQNN